MAVRDRAAIFLSCPDELRVAARRRKAEIVLEALTGAFQARLGADRVVLLSLAADLGRAGFTP